MEQEIDETLQSKMSAEEEEDVQRELAALVREQEAQKAQVSSSHRSCWLCMLTIHHLEGLACRRARPPVCANNGAYPATRCGGGGAWWVPLCPTWRVR